MRWQAVTLVATVGLSAAISTESAVASRRLGHSGGYRDGEMVIQRPEGDVLTRVPTYPYDEISPTEAPEENEDDYEDEYEYENTYSSVPSVPSPPKGGRPGLAPDAPTASPTMEDYYYYGNPDDHEKIIISKPGGDVIAHRPEGEIPAKRPEGENPGRPEGEIPGRPEDGREERPSDDAEDEGPEKGERGDTYDGSSEYSASSEYQPDEDIDYTSAYDSVYSWYSSSEDYTTDDSSSAPTTAPHFGAPRPGTGIPELGGRPGGADEEESFIEIYFIGSVEITGETLATTLRDKLQEWYAPGESLDVTATSRNDQFGGFTVRANIDVDVLTVYERLLEWLETDLILQAQLKVALQRGQEQAEEEEAQAQKEADAEAKERLILIIIIASCALVGAMLLFGAACVCRAALRRRQRLPTSVQDRNPNQGAAPTKPAPMQHQVAPGSRQQTQPVATAVLIEDDQDDLDDQDEDSHLMKSSKDSVKVLMC